MSSATADFGETIIKLIDKLAGKGSDIKLNFKDLTLEVGLLKAKLNGSIVLDILYVSEKK
jgi:hypothetical protein